MNVTANPLIIAPIIPAIMLQTRLMLAVLIARAASQPETNPTNSQARTPPG
jgi:hypothetical protein